MKSLAPLFLAAATCAAAQSTISPTDNFAYAANAGWINFHPSETAGLQVTESYLTGFAYAANFGWINFGDGSPENGHTYSNNSANDFGVNLSPDGSLSGRAYAANVGWITFEQTHGNPKLAFHGDHAITGFAYGANIGWISFDTPSSDLVNTRLDCPDSDGDLIGDAYEMLFAGNLTTLRANHDEDGDGHSDRDEYLAYTDPTNSASFLQIREITHIAGSTETTLTFTSSPNRTYRIFRNVNLSGVSISSEINEPSEGGMTTTSVTHTATERLFFSVTARKPFSL